MLGNGRFGHGSGDNDKGSAWVRVRVVGLRIKPESSKGLTFDQLSHQKETRVKLKFDTLQGSRNILPTKLKTSAKDQAFLSPVPNGVTTPGQGANGRFGRWVWLVWTDFLGRVSLDKHPQL